MLKKALLMLLCTNLCASEKPEGSSAFRAAVTAGAIGFGSIAYIMVSSNSDMLEASSRLSSDDIQRILAFGRAGISIAATAVGAFATAQLYPIGKEIYESTFPTKEQKAIQEARTIASGKKLAILKAEEGFRSCLINNRANSQINASGIPTTCEEAARFYALTAGISELNQMTKTFNEFRR
jgi:hypothetical protein